jgi:3-oxoacyl-[acyl-carrier-protein] synthase II
MKSDSSRRVVVTGIGVVSPIGSGKDTFWSALLAGKSGIGPVTAFDSTNFAAHIGAEVRDFDPSCCVKKQQAANMGRASQMAIGATLMALTDSRLDIESIPKRRIGVSMGTTSGEPLFVEHYNDAKKAGTEIDPAWMKLYPCHVIPTHIAIEFDLRGPSLMIPTACAAGNYAIGYGFDLIRTGRADVMLAGGSDAFSRIPYMGFARLGAIAPEKCQPFDKNRKGMIPGEGSGMLVLEPLDAALARGAKIYAEVLGYGVSCDAHHMTAAHPQADGAIRAMTAAMKNAGVGTEDIDYISAHGTGTPTNDRIESIGVRTLFGDYAPKVPMSSIKSMLGHTMGAASAIEAAACALAIDTGWIPPTINHEEDDPDCGLDIVPNEARKTDPKVVLNNAYAFGGNNASLCLGRYED